MKKITILDIEQSLYDVDTEYREALAQALMDLKYISDSPLNLSFGNEKQQMELDRVYNKTLKPEQIKEIINYISKEMKGDFQYGRYKNIETYYLSLAEQMSKNKKDVER